VPRTARRIRTRRSTPLAAFALACSLALVPWGCARHADEGPWTDRTLARLTLRDRVAQLVVMRIADPRDSTARDVAVGERVGGVLLAGGGDRDAAALLDTLARARPLAPLAVLEMDRGAGAVLSGATEFPLAGPLGAAQGADAARTAGESAGREAKGMGIHLAIVSAPPIGPDAGLQSFDARAPQAYDGVLAYLDGLRSSGVLVAARTFPEPPAPASAEAGFTTVGSDRAALEAGPLAFVRSFAAAGADGILLGAVAIPALTGDSVPLPVSSVAMDGDLRRDLVFSGLVMADVGRESPLTRAYGEREAAVRALAAGADVILGVGDARGTIDALVRAVQSGRISRARVDAAVRRVFAAKQRAGVGRRDESAEPGGSRPDPGPARDETRRAARLAFEQSTLLYGSVPGQVLGGCRRTVLATARGVALPVLSGALSPRVPGGLAPIQADTVALRGPLTAGGGGAPGEADCVIVARLPGAAPVVVDRVAPPPDTVRTPADTARRRVVDVAFATGDLPPYAAGAQVLAWGTGADAQASVAQALGGAGHADVRRPPASAWPPGAELRKADAAAVGMDSAKLAAVDAIIRKGIAEEVYPGAALAVVRHGALVRLRGYGRVGAGALSPAVSADSTLFDLASLTKVVGTTAAAMSLVDEGKLSLDVPVHRYLADFRGGDKGDVTIRNLLTHTAGLPPGEDLYNDVSSPEAALREVMKEPLVYTPGTRMVYSDFSMVLLKAVVERVVGEPIDRYLSHRVWAPLGMGSTQYLPPLADRERAAPGALRTERPYLVRGAVHDGNAFRLGGVAGHAGLFSTARDLAVYVQTLMAGGAYGPRRVWSRGVVSRFVVDQGLPGHRALGWDRPAAKSSAGALFSARSFGHTGFTGTSIWADPERDVFVVLLTNRTYDRGNEGQIFNVRRRVHEAVALAITDVKVTPRAGAVLPPELRPKPKPKPSRTARGRTGRHTTHATPRRRARPTTRRH
jgi:beta-N-acetylhexosaminidase